MVTFSVAVSIDFCRPSLSVCGHSHAQWMSLSPKVSTQVWNCKLSKKIFQVLN